MLLRPVLVGLLGMLVLLLGPVASAAVTVEEIGVPERTAAEKPFEVSVVLANDGPARDVHLFGALYTYEEGDDPCGPVTDPSFRAFTHVVQETVHLAADAETVHPREGGRWLHRYGVEDAGATPSEEQLCVFVAAASGGPVIQYEAFGATRLSVRARNAPPQVSFTVEPARPEAAHEATFRAEATDADGDPVSVSWDFGRFDAGGRAVAEGTTATHAFYPEGEYIVTVTASDGIDEVPLARTLTVVPTTEPDEERSFLPAAPWIILAAAALAALVLRRR